MNGLVSLEHAASLLACSQVMLIKLFKNSILQSVNVGRLTRIHQEDIEAWVRLGLSTSTNMNQKTARKGAAQ